MNTAARTQAPSMAELVRAISEEVAVPAEPSPVFMHLPKPHPIGRLLVLSTVGLIIIMATLLLVLTRHVQGLMADICEREELLAHPPLPALPSSVRLLDPSTFAIELATHPDQSARLHAARAHALVDGGRASEAIEGFAVACRLNDAPLAPADRVALGDALLATGRVDEARTLLLGIDPTQLDEPQRARSNDLLVRVAMA
ncbi:MAG TPA: hypothetical protein VHX44_12910 [Planctomycetota bacterium]|nr:hypothetical protein [Planctomycetota bacterium]